MQSRLKRPASVRPSPAGINSLFIRDPLFPRLRPIIEIFQSLPSRLSLCVCIFSAAALIHYLFRALAISPAHLALDEAIVFPRAEEQGENASFGGEES